MNDDYADRPNFKGRSVFGGVLATEEEQIQEMDGMVKLAHDAGYQLAVHAVGDRAGKQVINSFIRAIQENPSGNRRHYLLHSSMTDRFDFKRAATIRLCFPSNLCRVALLIILKIA